MSKYQDDNTAAAELLPVRLYYPFLYFPPFYTQEILMMLLNDVMIVCSVILAGKPLCMHRSSANGCLHTHQCPCQLTILTESTKCLHFVSRPIFMPVTYIYITIYIYIYIFIYIYIYVTGMKMGLEMKRQHFVLSVNMVNWHGHRQVCRWLSAYHLHMCSGFPAKMMEQTIVTSLNDVMKISCV